MHLVLSQVVSVSAWALELTVTPTPALNLNLPSALIPRQLMPTGVQLYSQPLDSSSYYAVMAAVKKEHAKSEKVKAKDYRLQL